MAVDMDSFDFSSSELTRYTRHLTLPHLGLEGQSSIKQGSVLIVGLGGLGSISSLYLTGAGIGTIGLIEDDTVSLDNLQRQILYTTDDVGTSKLNIAAQRLKAFNPEVEFKLFSQRLNLANGESIAKDFDIVVDGTDNLVTRQIINQICVEQGKPYIFGAVNLYDGQISVFDAVQGPCMACLFPNKARGEEEKQPEQLAVLNTIPAMIASLQTAEVIKLIVGIGKPLIGRLVIYNAVNVSFDQVKIEKNPACPVCG